MFSMPSSSGTLPCTVKPAALIPFSGQPDNGTISREAIVLSTTAIIIGRDTSCDYTLNDTNISRKHVRVTYSQRCWWIADLCSTNGVMVQDTRLRRGETVALRDGHKVCLCPVENADFHYVFKENHHSIRERFPVVPSDRRMFIEPRLRQGGVASNDLPPTPKADQENYMSRINRLINEKSSIEAELTLQKEQCRALVDKEHNYKSTIANLRSTIQRYVSLNNHLLSASVPSSPRYEMTNEDLQALIADIKNEFKCSICLEFLISPTSLNCSHVFCQHCLRFWQQAQRSSNHVSCPMCRVEIKCQTPVLAFENVIKRVLAATLDAQSKQDRSKEIEERKQSLIQTSNTNQQGPSASTPIFLDELSSSDTSFLDFPGNESNSIDTIQDVTRRTRDIFRLLEIEDDSDTNENDTSNGEGQQ